MVMINNNLKIFISVAEKGSITETANDLYISQPAVSKTIKNLEEELNLKLFHRDKRQGLSLTDAGFKILNLARQMNNIENRIYQTAYRENNFMGGKVTIASTPILTSLFLAPVFHKFTSMYPKVNLELIEGTPNEIHTAVESHQVDFGFIVSPESYLDKKVLFHDYMIAISRSAFPTVNPVSLDDDTDTFIFCKVGYETVIDALKLKTKKIDNHFVVQQPETVIAMVEEGNGIGVLSNMLLSMYPHKLYMQNIDPIIEMEVGLIAMDLNDLTPVATKLMEEIEQEVANSKLVSTAN